jgi:hypothetical protein
LENQLTRGLDKRIMYVENKAGLIGDAHGRIGWVTFSKTGRTVYYRDLVLTRLKGGGIRGNFFDQATGDEYWISGVKKRGSNGHWAESAIIAVDPDAEAEYRKQRGRAGG